MAEQVQVDLQCAHGQCITLARAFDDRARIGRVAAQVAVEHGHAAAGDVALHAAAQAAAAVQQGQAVALQQVCRHAPVAPFTGDAVVAADQPAVHAVAAAGTGAEDGAEHARLALGGAAIGFGQRKALHVVAELQPALQAVLQVLLDPLPGQGRDVGAEQAAAVRVADPGHGDADRGRWLAQHRIGRLHQAGDRGQEGRIVAAGGVDALPVQRLQAGVEGRQFDLGAADVDPVAGLHGGVLQWWMVTPCTTRFTVPSGKGLSGLRPWARERCSA